MIVKMLPWNFDLGLEEHLFTKNIFLINHIIMDLSIENAKSLTWLLATSSKNAFVDEVLVLRFNGFYKVIK